MSRKYLLIGTPNELLMLSDLNEFSNEKNKKVFFFENVIDISNVLSI